MSAKKYKYRINELLNSLPLKTYRKALRVIPKELHISDGTFKNYRDIQLSDEKDIPHEKVCVLEKLFGLQPGELQNYAIDVQPLSSHDLECEESGLVTKHQLQKA